LRCAFRTYTEASSGCCDGSDGEGEVVKGDAEPVAVWGIGGDVVVSAPEVLYEGMADCQDPRRSVSLQAPHRPQAGFEPPVVCLDRVVRTCPPCGRGRHRFQAFFRRAATFAFWRLGFKQSSLYLIARVPRNAVPAPGHGNRFFWHAVFPGRFYFAHGSAIGPTDTSSNPCPLRGQYLQCASWRTQAVAQVPADRYRDHLGREPEAGKDRDRAR
jgi:hypothetical protein